MRRNAPVQRVLEEFAGTWTVSRRILQDDGPEAGFEGQAVWTPQDGGLAYVETGLLTIAGQGRFAAERRYFWDADLRVHFDDGRFFHQVPPEGGRTGHWCDPDQYDVEYDFADWPAFTTTWQVRGPRKSYRMTTGYRR
ncbi:hypothetical protein LA6_002353 [Marinibacterium anthonyi]|nr:hypothetical protein LA6_002353 [Marinibacterium anthonyi]